MTYAELQVTTHFSFLRGASSAEELFAQAAMLGIPALGVVDRNSIAGIVRAHDAAKTTGVRLVIGCRLDLEDGTAMLVYPMDRAAYSRLCRLLSIGKGRAGKGACRHGWDDVAAWGEGQIVVFVPGRIDDGLGGRLRRLKSDFGDRAYLALTRRFRPNDALRLYRLEETARAARVPTVATNDVLYHAPERRMLQDVVTCIREGCTIDNAGFRRERFADRFLKPPAEMARLFERHPDAIARTTEIAERCTFSLSELEYQYPSENRSRGLTLRSHPVAFLRGDLAANGYVPAGDLSATRDGRRVSVAGLVLVRQRPGSANGVLFITLEDGTDIANLIVWPSLFERQRRLVLSANMIGCRGKLQREGQVIHVIAEHLVDLSGLLGAVGEREEVFPLPHGRGDEAKHGSGPEPRDALGRKPRDIYIPDLRTEVAINVKTRDFR